MKWRNFLQGCEYFKNQRSQLTFYFFTNCFSDHVFDASIGKWVSWSIPGSFWVNFQTHPWAYFKIRQSPVTSMLICIHGHSKIVTLKNDLIRVVSNLYSFWFCSCRLAPVFSFFVPFYLLIPRMPVTQVLGQIHITNKSLVYVVGLQVSIVLEWMVLN